MATIYIGYRYIVKRCIWNRPSRPTKLQFATEPLSALPGMTDHYHLRRFKAAQDDGGTYEAAIAELRAGRKTTHWMWFVFPQIAGLGQSETSRRYAIASRAEAEAYLHHARLGPRLIECAQIIETSRTLSATEIFGSVDANKLHSCMTLFMRAAPGEPVFARVLARYFAGIPDSNTDRLLGSQDVT